MLAPVQQRARGAIPAAGSATASSRTAAAELRVQLNQVVSCPLLDMSARCSMRPAASPRYAACLPLVPTGPYALPCLACMLC